MDDFTKYQTNPLVIETEGIGVVDNFANQHNIMLLINQVLAAKDMFEYLQPFKAEQHLFVNLIIPTNIDKWFPSEEQTRAEVHVTTLKTVANPSFHDMIAVVASRNLPEANVHIRVGRKGGDDMIFYYSIPWEEYESKTKANARDASKGCWYLFLMVYIQAKLYKCIKCHKEVKNKSQRSYCGHCRRVCYCSQACQSQDWENHQRVCKLVQEYLPKY